MKRRDLLGMGAALGVGMASKGVLGQQNTGGSAPPRRPPSGGGGRGGGGLFSNSMMAPINSHTQPSSVDLNYKPRRVNKMIELWEDGQPIYDELVPLGPTMDAYAQGVRMSQTYADAINVDFEHGPLDFESLSEFMRGLVDGGPTRSGHRTPAVWVQPCIIGLDATYMRANTWVLEQLLDCGVHGFEICHARDAESIKVASQMACRYPFPRAGINVLDTDAPSAKPITVPRAAGIQTLDYRGLRGAGASYPPQIWGVSSNMYNHLADLWPLNPRGEIVFGVKIEDTFADQDYEETIALPGVAFAEWGPGDHSYWLYGLSIMPEDGSRVDVRTRPEMVKVRQDVLDACKRNKVMFLNAANADPNSPDYVITQIQDGVMVFEANEAAAIIGREYTKRKMPV